MIITADIIRRLPFANLITRITPDMELLIAQDMAAQARREGHRKSLPTVTSQKAEDIALARAIIEADVWRYLVKFGPGTITAIRNTIKRDRHKIDNALVYMVADGRVKRLNRPTRGGSVPAVFDIDPRYSPTQGQCDPAQPGNPTGTRSDVTTVDPLTTPGALNQPPVTQEAAR